MINTFTPSDFIYLIIYSVIIYNNIIKLNKGNKLMDYQSINEIEESTSSWSFNYSNFVEYYTADLISFTFGIILLVVIVFTIFAIRQTIKSRSFIFTGGFVLLLIFNILIVLTIIPNDTIKDFKIRAAVEHNISEKYNLSEIKNLHRLSKSLDKEYLTYEMLYHKNEENKTIPVVIKINKVTGEPEILTGSIMTPEYVKGLERINK